MTATHDAAAAPAQVVCESAGRVLRPDHRDALLSAEEHASGDTMLICVSGAGTPRLVLDL